MPVWVIVLTVAGVPVVANPVRVAPRVMAMRSKPGESSLTIGALAGVVTVVSRKALGS